jgi:uncharacterized repeat protein (TIGR03803 family)
MSVDVLYRRQCDYEPELSATGSSTQTVWSFDADAELMSSHQRRLAYTLLRRGKAITALLRLRSATDVLASAQHAKGTLEASANRLSLPSRSRREDKRPGYSGAQGSARDSISVMLERELRSPASLGAIAGCLPGRGTVFKITLAGTLTTLHSFALTDGVQPYDCLIQARDGNLYGTTANGGPHNGHGTVFKITTDGTFTHTAQLRRY